MSLLSLRPHRPKPRALERGPKPYKLSNRPEGDTRKAVRRRTAVYLHAISPDTSNPNFPQNNKIKSLTPCVFINQLMALNCTRVVVSEKPSFIWLRERGTVSENAEELIEFVQSTSEAGPVSGDGWNVLRGEK